jgi:hypothetical protein
MIIVIQCIEAAIPTSIRTFGRQVYVKASVFYFRQSVVFLKDGL